jgi:hypothetical protein
MFSRTSKAECQMLILWTHHTVLWLYCIVPAIWLADYHKTDSMEKHNKMPKNVTVFLELLRGLLKRGHKVMHEDLGDVNRDEIYDAAIEVWRRGIMENLSIIL